MTHEAVNEPRGILKPNMLEQKFHLTRLVPSADLADWVEHYWIVRWDLRGQEPYLSETLPFPTVHLVVQRGQSELYGVMRGKFGRMLKDKGMAFGIKFKPGAFYPFVKRPISAFTDRVFSLDSMFGEAGSELERAILQVDNDDDQMMQIAEDFLRERLPEEDENVALIKRVVDLIETDKTIIKVDDVIGRVNLTKRTLQRLFSQYVGVSPKWVIQRYRLHEAADQLAHGGVNDWPRLAATLGYFDQAHFIKDFKAIVGKTPAEYAKEASEG